MGASTKLNIEALLELSVALVREESAVDILSITLRYLISRMKRHYLLQETDHLEHRKATPSGWLFLWVNKSIFSRLFVTLSNSQDSDNSSPSTARLCWSGEMVF